MSERLVLLHKEHICFYCISASDLIQITSNTPPISTSIPNCSTTSILISKSPLPSKCIATSYIQYGHPLFIHDVTIITTFFSQRHHVHFRHYHYVSTFRLSSKPSPHHGTRHDMTEGSALFQNAVYIGLS